MARKTGTVGNNGIADINSRLLAQDLANGIRSRPPVPGTLNLT